MGSTATRRRLLRNIGWDLAATLTLADGPAGHPRAAELWGKQGGGWMAVADGQYGVVAIALDEGQANADPQQLLRLACRALGVI